MTSRWCNAGKAPASGLCRQGVRRKFRRAWLLFSCMNLAPEERCCSMKQFLTPVFHLGLAAKLAKKNHKIQQAHAEHRPPTMPCTRVAAASTLARISLMQVCRAMSTCSCRTIVRTTGRPWICCSAKFICQLNGSLVPSGSPSSSISCSASASVCDRWQRFRCSASSPNATCCLCYCITSVVSIGRHILKPRSSPTVDPAPLKKLNAREALRDLMFVQTIRCK